MKKTGFTLVEILAVLVILGILAAITVPIVGNLLTGSKDDLYGVQMKNIENGAKGWATKNTVVLPAEEGDVITITLGQLKLSGDVVVDIKNPKTGQLFPNDMEIEIKRLHRNYVYNIKDETGEDTSPLNPDLLMPTLILNGSTTHYVEINAEVEYEDPGYTARKIDGSNLTDVTVEIKANNTVVSSVDTTRMGQYKITYTATDQGKSISMIRTVIVRDTTPPVLTVPEETTVQLTELATFNYMTAVSATDNSLEVPTITRSGLVSSIPGTYTVVYTATDGSNNKSTKSRRIIVQDNQGPNIAFSMNGNSTWAQSRSTSITVTDISGIDINSLKYLWATSSSGVTEGSFSTNLTNGATLSTPSLVTGDYYLWVLAKDNSGNTSIVRSEVFKLDNTRPVITRNGNASVTINVGSSYTDAGATVTDAHSGVTGGVTTTGTINVNLPGTYTITYTKSDNAGNAATPVIRTVIVQDTVIPTVAFGTNGQGVWAKSRSTTVTANDNVAINTSSLRYLWTTTASGIVEANFSASFTNGATLTSSAGITGDYYLWVLAKDTSGNTNIVRSNVFKLDNTLPTITHPGNTVITTGQVSNYNLMTGVSGSDSHSGVNGSGVVVSGNISIIPGNYNITYTVTDNAGNIQTVTRIITVQDTQAPVITLLGSNPMNINIGSSYIEPGATAVDDVDGNFTNAQIAKTGAVNVYASGTYTITYSVTDSSGNTGYATRMVNVIDNVAPIVTFGTNGNGTYAKNRSTTVTATDDSPIPTLRYQWTTSISTPSEGSFVNSFNSGGTINSPSGVTGEYYLWILAKDSVGNTTIQRTNVFRMDNLAPVVSSIALSANDINQNSFVITRNGNAIDANSGLATNPYKFQVMISGVWTTYCQNSGSSCSVTNLDSNVLYTYRLCVSDNVENENCTLLGTAYTQIPHVTYVIDNTVATAMYNAYVEKNGILYVSMNEGIYNSINGINWQFNSRPSGTLIYSQEDWLIGRAEVSDNPTYVQRTLNGINWQSHPLTVGSRPNSLAFQLKNSTTTLLVFGQDDIFYSTDGVAWTSSRGIYRYSAGYVVNNMFFLHAQERMGNTYRLRVSSTGSTWTNVFQEYNSISNVVYGNGIYAIGIDNKIYTSSNGETWTERHQMDQNIKKIDYNGGLFIAAGDNGKILRSTNGISWTETSFGTTNYRDIQYLNNRWFIIGVSGSYHNIVTSTNGIDWSNSINTLSSSNSVTLHYLGNKWITITNNCTVYYSTNGTTWKDASVRSRTASSSNNEVSSCNYQNLSYKNNKFYVVGISYTSSPQPTTYSIQIENSDLN